MYRTSLFIIIAITTIMMGVIQADARTASGKVVTCPGGDPIPDYLVRLFNDDGDLIGIATTDSFGKWVIDVTFVECGPTKRLRAYIVTNKPPGCSGGCCSERYVDFPCVSDDVHFEDLQFKCGVKIQCPQSQ